MGLVGMVGTRIGPYRVEGVLGQGGMAAVYRARHEILGRRVAIKLIHADLADRSEMVGRFLDEARTLVRIRHPNIVDVFDVGQTPDGRVYTIMELLEGRTLLDWRVAHPKPAVVTVCSLGYQIASALAATHAAGVVHRDLTPVNVFCTDGEVEPCFLKVLDFGVAKLGAQPTQLTRAGLLAGTPEYMAPEQLEETMTPDHRVDLYSLGVVLYELCCGRRPIEGESPPEILQRKRRDAPTPIAVHRPDVDPGLARVLMRALERVPDARFGSMRDLGLALVELGDPLAKGPVPWRIDRLRVDLARAQGGRSAEAAPFEPSSYRIEPLAPEADTPAAPPRTEVLAAPHTEAVAPSPRTEVLALAAPPRQTEVLSSATPAGPSATVPTPPTAATIFTDRGSIALGGLVGFATVALLLLTRGDGSSETMPALRQLYVRGLLVTTAIVFFSAVTQLIAAARLRQNRHREIYFGLCLIFSGIGTYVAYDGYASATRPWLLRVAGASLYFFFTCGVLAAYSFLDHDAPSDAERLRERSSVLVENRRRIVWAMVAVGVAGALVDLLTDWPIAYRGVGPASYPVLGRIESWALPPLSVLAHAAYGAAACVIATVVSQVAVRRGHGELRSLPVVLIVAGPPFAVDLLSYAQIIHTLPIGGFLSAVGAMAAVWYRLDRQAVLIAAESQRSELGGYRLLHRIGAGGMAEVFLAQKSGPDGFSKEVAVKRILPHLASDPAFIAMFLDEARLAARLSHPNIVEIRELGCDGGVYFMVMEHVRGRTLDALLREGRRLTDGLAALVGIQILAGLAHAHALADEEGRPLGVVHRDVSPQNVIFGDTGVVKLLDFGIARAATQAVKTRTGAIKGKLSYMSPEQLRGDPLDGRCDLFSLGVVLYQATTGQLPFGAANDVDAVLTLLDGRFAPPSAHLPRIDRALERVIVRALERDRERRHASAAEMSAELEAMLAAGGLRLTSADLATWLGHV